ncbi:MAG: SDR family oxidoreductase [Eubacteriaceae bacterium]|nr:SDR family oxidoreductase [Eubacteriaceae bacterium]
MKKVVLVTGGTKNIGRHIALEFARNNFDVIICSSRDTVSAEETKKEVEKYDVRCFALTIDVSNKQDVVRLKEFISEHYGYLNTLVNNAGILPKNTSPDDLSEDNWYRVMDVNLNGTYLVSKYMLPLLKAGKDPSIINITSTAAFTGGGGSIAYAASKGGIVSLTRALAKVFGKDGIRVNGIAPTLILTDMLKNRFKNNPQDLEKKLESVPLNRWCSEDEVAELAYFLSKPLYIHGQIIIMDGGRELGV